MKTIKSESTILIEYNKYVAEELTKLGFDGIMVSYRSSCGSIVCSIKIIEKKGIIFNKYIEFIIKEDKAYIINKYEKILFDKLNDKQIEIIKAVEKITGSDVVIVL